MAMVLDRLFLWIFTVAVLVGTAGIILQAPTLYDDRDPIDYQMTTIGMDQVIVFVSKETQYNVGWSVGQSRCEDELSINCNRWKKL